MTNPKPRRRGHRATFGTPYRGTRRSRRMTPSKAAVQRAGDVIYTSEADRAALRKALREDKGGVLVDVLAERYADAAISGGEAPEPTAASLAEAVAMHLVETSG